MQADNHRRLTASKPFLCRRKYCCCRTIKRRNTTVVRSMCRPPATFTGCLVHPSGVETSKKTPKNTWFKTPPWVLCFVFCKADASHWPAQPQGGTEATTGISLNDSMQHPTCANKASALREVQGGLGGGRSQFMAIKRQKKTNGGRFRKGRNRRPRQAL